MTSIESLEPRNLFSAAAHTALVPLRADIASLPLPISVMKWAFHAEMKNVSSELKIFDSPTDGELITTVVANFNRDVATLTADTKVSQILFVRDVNRFIQDENASARRPENKKLSAKVFRDEYILQAQAQATQNTLESDSALVLNDYFAAAPVISATHPVDATLADEANTISQMMTQYTQKLGTYSAQILTQDVPNFIAAEDPSGDIE